MSPETLRCWVHQAEHDEGLRPGATTEDRERLQEFEREVKELRRANDILKAASAFFAAEHDRPPQAMIAFIDRNRHRETDGLPWGSSRSAGSC